MTDMYLTFFDQAVQFEDLEPATVPDGEVPEPPDAVYSLTLVESDNPTLRGFDIKRVTPEYVAYDDDDDEGYLAPAVTECWDGRRFSDGPHALTTFTEDDVSAPFDSLLNFIRFCEANDLTISIHPTNPKEQ